jgi:hypothetical protein
MGVTRFDDAPENRLISSLIDSRQTARERKGSVQRVSGGNLAFLVSETEDLFDWSGLLDGPGGVPTYGQARFVITLTSSTGGVPLVDVAVVVYYSPDGITWEEYTYERGESDQYGGVSPEMFRALDVAPGADNGPGEVRYALQLFGKENTHAAFKLQVAGIDAVSINVTRIA